MASRIRLAGRANTPAAQAARERRRGPSLRRGKRLGRGWRCLLANLGRHQNGARIMLSDLCVDPTPWIRSRAVSWAEFLEPNGKFPRCSSAVTRRCRSFADRIGLHPMVDPSEAGLRLSLNDSASTARARWKHRKNEKIRRHSKQCSRCWILELAGYLRAP
jgi:hypothetical protein